MSEIGSKIIKFATQNPSATLREIQIGVNASSVSLVHYHLKRRNIPSRKENMAILMDCIENLQAKNNRLREALKKAHEELMVYAGEYTDASYIDEALEACGEVKE